MSEDGAVITWDYFGHHKNVYVEYIVENSKALLCICSHVSKKKQKKKHERTNGLAAYNKIHLSNTEPQSNYSPSAAPVLGKEDWKKELVNGSHWHMIKGLKPGTSYRVRVVARDPTDPTVHSTDEVLVAVPGEAACLRVDGLCVLVVFFFFGCPIFFFPCSCLIPKHTRLHSDQNAQ